jgi:hypothetical protein
MLRQRGIKMNEVEILSEIKDANLNYLMLAQQLIRSDKATAIFRLGISKDIADLLEGLSNLQLLKLISANMMIARFLACSLTTLKIVHKRTYIQRCSWLDKLPKQWRSSQY